MKRFLPSLSTLHSPLSIVSLLFLSLATASAAQITILGDRRDQLRVETDAYMAHFDRGTLNHLHNKRTGETHTLPPGTTPVSEYTKAAILGTNTIDDFSPEAEIQINKINPNRAEILFRQHGAAMTLSIGVDPVNDDLLIQKQGVSPRPGVRGIQWGIENLDIHNLSLLIPSQTVQQIDASSGIQHRTCSYPHAFGWEAQLAIVESESGGFYVRGTDPTFRFKELNYDRGKANFALSFGTINQAPWDTLTSAESVVWRLNTYAGEWCVPAQIHRDWMEQAYNPVRLTDMPEWVGDIGLVVLHTALDIDMLKGLAEQVEPTQTLLYLTDWRKHSPDVMFPDYTPRHDGLDTFLRVARLYGFRVMLHVNLYSCSPVHPIYNKLKTYQIRHPTGELSGWLWDKTGHPERNAHISLASSEWRRLLIRQFKSLWEKYAVDIFFLDVSHYIVNDGNGLLEGLTSAEANVLMHRELMEAMPGVVLAGELLHEVTFFRESFAQRKPLAHLPHPISAFLFGPYTQFMGSLGFPREHETELLRQRLKHHDREGVLPTARIPEASVLTKPNTREILDVARQWQALKWSPNVHCHWCENTLFQYTTAAGEIVTYQNVDGVHSLDIPGGKVYQRVSGVTQAVTRWSLPGWRAYNEEMLLGLDSNKYYSLRDTPRDFSQLHINALSPDVYVIDTRVTEQAAVFRLEATNAIENTSVGMFLPTAPITSVPDTLSPLGTGYYILKADPSQPVVIILSAPSIPLPYNLLNAPYIAGNQKDGLFHSGKIEALGERRTITLNGVHKETIYAHPPRHDTESIPPTQAIPDAGTIVQFTFTLPDTASTLSYSMGLAGERSEGVLFQIRINGKRRVNIFKDTFDWTDGTLSLAEFAGGPVLLEFVTDPGQYHGDGADYDWAHWGDLIITADTHPADVNGDGMVNILDLTLVAQAIGNNGGEGDVNGDGVVNVMDLVLVANEF